MERLVSDLRQAGGHTAMPMSAFSPDLHEAMPRANQNHKASRASTRDSFLKPIADEDRVAIRFDQAHPPLMACLLQALEGLAQGVALFNENSHLLYANLAAQFVLAEGQWSAEDGVLLSIDPLEREAWMRALRHAVNKHARSLVEIKQKKGSLFAATMPVLVGTEVFVMANFGPQATSAALALQMFASLHHLTFAEVEVLDKLFKGMRPSAIAEAHKVAHSTIVSQVKAIRAKTGCTTASQLLVKLSRLPALRPADLLGVSVNLFG